MYFGSWRIVSEGSITTSLLIAYFIRFPAYSQLAISVFLQSAAVNDVITSGLDCLKVESFNS